MKILFLTRRHPYPLSRGDNRRNFHLIESLSRYAEVRVITLGHGLPLPLRKVQVQAIGVGTGSRRGLGRDAPAVILGNLQAPDPHVPLQVRASLDSRLTAAIRREVEIWQPDVVHATPSTMASHLPRAGGSVHRHLDLIDALSIVIEDQAAASRGMKKRLLLREAASLRSYEASAVTGADSSSLVSSHDKARAPGIDAAAVIPMGVDTDEFAFETPSERGPVVMFCGHLNWPPNIESVQFQVHEILPLLRTMNADARLRIVGADAPAHLRSTAQVEGVDFIGEVPQVAPQLHRAACALIPMLSGAGMKTKVLEAFAAGTPVVSNRKGVAGIPEARHGHNFLLAEAPREFADACARLISDSGLRCELAEAARRLVLDNYSWDRQARAMLTVYGSS